MIEKIIQGLQMIVEKEKEEAEMSADHDTILVGQPELYTKEEIQELEDLGFHIDEEQECFYHFV
jgi:hypothetical protein